MIRHTSLILLLALSTLSIKLNLKDIVKNSGWNNSNSNSSNNSWNNSNSNTSSWNNNSNNGHSNGNGDVDFGHHNFSLLTSVGELGGFSSAEVLAGYVKQLVLMLTSSDSQVLVVRLERQKNNGNYYKIIYRIRQANGDCIYIGIVFHACNGQLKIVKFFQSDDLEEIINCLQFCENKLFKYPDGDLSNQCGNSILSILRGFCDAIGGGGNGGNNNNNNNGGGLEELDNCSGGNCGGNDNDNSGNDNSWGNQDNGNSGGCANGNCGGSSNGGSSNGGSNWGNNGSSNGGSNGGGNGIIKINVKIPGSKNPTGKDIILGAGRP